MRQKGDENERARDIGREGSGERWIDGSRKRVRPREGERDRCAESQIEGEAGKDRERQRQRQREGGIRRKR